MLRRAFRHHVNGTLESLPSVISRSFLIVLGVALIMQSILTPAFDHCPEEAAIIGRILAAYAELEFAFGLCVERTMRKPQQATETSEYWADNRHLGLKVLYRLRSESSRLHVGDAIGRAEFVRHGLEAPYADAIGALRHCLKIRNQYAHCHYAVSAMLGLCLTDLEENAQGAGDFEFSFDWHHVSLELLQEQQAYFEYAKRCLDFIHGEFRVKAGMASAHEHAMPSKMPQPLLHSPLSECELE